MVPRCCGWRRWTMRARRRFCAAASMPASFESEPDALANLLEICAGLPGERCVSARRV